MCLQSFIRIILSDKKSILLLTRLLYAKKEESVRRRCHREDSVLRHPVQTRQGNTRGPSTTTSDSNGQMVAEQQPRMVDDARHVTSASISCRETSPRVRRSLRLCPQQQSATDNDELQLHSTALSLFIVKLINLLLHITFLASRGRREMHSNHTRLSVCPRPHALITTRTGCNLGEW